MYIDPGITKTTPATNHKNSPFIPTAITFLLSICVHTIQIVKSKALFDVEDRVALMRQVLEQQERLEFRPS